MCHGARGGARSASAAACPEPDSNLTQFPHYLTTCPPPLPGGDFWANSSPGQAPLAVLSLVVHRAAGLDRTQHLGAGCAILAISR